MATQADEHSATYAERLRRLVEHLTDGLDGGGRRQPARRPRHGRGRGPRRRRAVGPHDLRVRRARRAPSRPRCTTSRSATCTAQRSPGRPARLVRRLPAGPRLRRGGGPQGRADRRGVARGTGHRPAGPPRGGSGPAHAAGHRRRAPGRGEGRRRRLAPGRGRRAGPGRPGRGGPRAPPQRRAGVGPSRPTPPTPSPAPPGRGARPTSSSPSTWPSRTWRTSGCWPCSGSCTTSSATRGAPMRPERLEVEGFTAFRETDRGRLRRRRPLRPRRTDGFGQVERDRRHDLRPLRVDAPLGQEGGGAGHQPGPPPGPGPARLHGRGRRVHGGPGRQGHGRRRGHDQGGPARAPGRRRRGRDPGRRRQGPHRRDRGPPRAHLRALLHLCGAAPGRVRRPPPRRAPQAPGHAPGPPRPRPLRGHGPGRPLPGHRSRGPGRGPRPARWPSWPTPPRRPSRRPNAGWACSTGSSSASTRPVPAWRSWRTVIAAAKAEADEAGRRVTALTDLAVPDDVARLATKADAARKELDQARQGPRGRGRLPRAGRSGVRRPARSGRAAGAPGPVGSTGRTGRAHPERRHPGG